MTPPHRAPGEPLGASRVWERPHRTKVVFAPWFRPSFVGRARLAMTLGSAAVLVAAAACGGADTPEPSAGAQSYVEEKAAPGSVQEEAQKLFASLSEELDKLAGDQAVDPAWLKGRLSAVVELDPKHTMARYNLAVLLEREGNHKEARAQYEEIAQRDPGFAPAAENLAAYHVEAGEVAKASAIYKRLIEADPANVTSRLGLARLYAVDGKYEDAIELCRKVLQRKADAIEAFRILARSYKAVGNVPMAELIIGRGLKVDEKDVELHYLLAEILFERGDLIGGVGKLKELVRLKPDWLKVRAQLAEIALKYRDFGNAAQQYEAIVREQANHRPSQIGLAVAYKGLGRYDEAEKIYTALLKQNPKDPDATWNMASLYHHHLNKYDEAIRLYESYEQAAPADDEQRKQVASLIKKVRATQQNQEAEKERLAKEKRRQEAVQQACAQVAAGKPVGKVAEEIGAEEERIGAAWQILTEANDAMTQGDQANGDRLGKCALAILPDTPNAKVSACAPMLVMWTRDILYPLGRLEDALASIGQALACDPENPDAQLIQQQLQEIIKQQEAAGGQQVSEAAGGAGTAG